MQAYHNRPEEALTEARDACVRTGADPQEVYDCFAAALGEGVAND